MTDPSPDVGLCAIWLASSARAQVQSITCAWQESAPASSIRTYLSIGRDQLMVLAATRSTEMARQLASDHATVAARDGATAYRFVRHSPSSSPPVADGPYLWVIRLSAPDPHASRIREWFHQEHFERQLQTPGILGCRAYETLAEPHHFLNIWSIADPGIPSSTAYAEVRATSWAARIDEDLAAATATRSIYGPIDPRVSQRQTSDFVHN